MTAQELIKQATPDRWRRTVRDAYWAGRRWNERAPQEIALRKLSREYGGVVRSGPFCGMTSLQTMDDGCVIPKLLGCYEEEIHPFIEVVVERRPRRVLDVGCASGWYTTGLARRLPDAEVIGYDLDSAALARAAELARLNGLDGRVQLRREALTPQALADMVLPGETFVLVDIDGPELQLVDPDVDERLLEADWLVEFHDHVDPTTSDTIVGRFRRTHAITRVLASGRDARHYRELDGFRSRWVRDAAVAERRPVAPRQEFALMLRR